MLARRGKFVEIRWIMTHEAAALKAREIASRVLAPSAGQNDKAGRFSTQAVEPLGESGLLGLPLPGGFGGSGSGPCSFGAVATRLPPATPRCPTGLPRAQPRTRT